MSHHQRTCIEVGVDNFNYNALAQENLFSRSHTDLVQVSQDGFYTDPVLGPLVADRVLGFGLHAQPA